MGGNIKGCRKNQKKSLYHLMLKILYRTGVFGRVSVFSLTAGDRNIRNMWNIKDLRWNIRVNFRTSRTALDFASVPNVPIGRALSH